MQERDRYQEKTVTLELRTKEKVVFRERIVPIIRNNKTYHVYLRYMDPADQICGPYVQGLAEKTLTEELKEQQLKPKPLKIFFNGFGLAGGTLDSTEEFAAYQCLDENRPLLLASIKELPPHFDEVTQWEILQGYRDEEDCFDMGVDARMVLEASLRSGYDLEGPVDIWGFSEGSALAQAFAVELDLWRKIKLLHSGEAQIEYPFNHDFQQLILYLEARGKALACTDLSDIFDLPQDSLVVLSPLGFIDLDYGPDGKDNRGWNILINFWIVVLQVFEIEAVTGLAEVIGRKPEQHRYLRGLLMSAMNELETEPSSGIADTLNELIQAYLKQKQQEWKTIKAQKKLGGPFIYRSEEFSLENFASLVKIIVRLALSGRDGFEKVLKYFKKALAASPEGEGPSQVTYIDSLRHIFNRLFSLDENIPAKERVNRAVWQMTKLGSRVGNIDSLGNNWNIHLRLPIADAMMPWEKLEQKIQEMQRQGLIPLDNSLKQGNLGDSNVSLGLYKCFRALYPNVGKLEVSTIPGRPHVLTENSDKWVAMLGTHFGPMLHLTAFYYALVEWTLMFNFALASDDKDHTAAVTP